MKEFLKRVLREGCITLSGQFVSIFGRRGKKKCELMEQVPPGKGIHIHISLNGPHHKPVRLAQFCFTDTEDEAQRPTAEAPRHTAMQQQCQHYNLGLTPQSKGNSCFFWPRVWLCQVTDCKGTPLLRENSTSQGINSAMTASGGYGVIKVAGADSSGIILQSPSLGILESRGLGVPPHWLQRTVSHL